MQKFLFLFLVAVICAFQLERLYGSGGDIDDGHIKSEIIKQTAINQDLINRNNEMIIKTAGLKGSPDAIEARARLELNMVKNGETLILLPGNDTTLAKSAIVAKSNYTNLHAHGLSKPALTSGSSKKIKQPNVVKDVNKKVGKQN